MPTFEEVMALASLPEETLSLCLAGNLVGELADLQRQRAEAGLATNIGERSPAAVLDERIGELAERMKAATVAFKLRAMHGRTWDALYAAYPVRDKDESAEDWARHLFPWTTDMVSKTCVDPAMTAAQVAELVDRLHAVAWAKLQNTCWALNAGEVEAPNFVSVSPQTQTSDGTSAPPTTPASVSPNGRVASRPRRLSTSTTAKDVSPAA